LRKIDYPEDNFSSGEWKRSLKLRNPLDFVWFTQFLIA